MKKKLIWLTVFSMFVILSACVGGSGGGGGGSDSGTSSDETTTTDDSSKLTLNIGFSTLFDGDTSAVSPQLNINSNSAVVLQENALQVSNFPISFATELFSGNLTVLKASDDSLVFDSAISVSLDSSWDAQFQQTVVLQPNTYKISLQFAKNGHQYLGTTTASIVQGDNTVSMDVSPVIGDTLVSTTIASELPNFIFNYNAADFSSLSVPVLDVIIDGSTDTLNLAQFTGSERVMVNRSGNHSVELKLRDGTTDIAAYGPIVVNFTAGNDLTMDLTAIFGRMAIDLNVNGGDAVFDFAIPSEVIDEVGAVGNLRTTFTLNGTNNDPTSDILDLVIDASGDYSGTTTITGIQYDTLDMNLLFQDISVSPYETIGSCNFSVDLDVSSDFGTCAINLVRRAEVSGNFYQVVGINVMESNGAGATGIPVYIYVDGSNDVLLGSTGEGSFGTDNYLEAMLQPGTYSFRARGGSNWGEETNVTVDASFPENVFIYLSNSYPE